MSKKVVIVDSASGNLLSVYRAFQHCGANVLISNNAKFVAEADSLVLPGVGTFGNFMNTLRSAGLLETIKNFAESKKPILGICVGMQVMFEQGFEFGEYAGLGLIPGIVKKIPVTFDISGRANKLPHIGWYRLNIKEKWVAEKNSILINIPNQQYGYFIHSYMAEVSYPQHVIVEYHCNELTIPALVRRENIYGSQFHLEKSGKFGLEIIKNFICLDF